MNKEQTNKLWLVKYKLEKKKVRQGIFRLFHQFLEKY